MKIKNEKYWDDFYKNFLVKKESPFPDLFIKKFKQKKVMSY